MKNGPLTPDEIYEWVLLLESGRFKQTRGKLKDGDSYCCLGLACLVRDVDMTEEIKHVLRWDHKVLGDHPFPPFDLVDAAGGCDPELKVPPELWKKTRYPTGQAEEVLWERASSLNDNYELTFAEIAQCIRYTFPEVFA